MKLKIDLQNCYGIGALNHEVEYPANNNTAVVYAPNGSMKTSLTKTFDALLAGLPRQAEWEAYVSQFQGCAAGASSAEKWQMMEKIFDSE